MEKTVSCIILLLAVALLAPGCMAVEGANTIGVLETQEIAMIDDEASVPASIMTADVNTTNLTAKPGDTVIISLRENPTTGYLWNVTKSAGLELVSDEYVMDNTEKRIVGASGVHRWTIKAVTIGIQSFSAAMMRTSGDSTGEEKTYDLTITVKEIVEEIAKEPFEEIPRENRVAKYSVI
ncbi:MAG TPA: protease inhibitor I42 family protein [Methanospirillum sp.]|nr:protease inhibitor I42 family protein [Methanospirillum sp.]